MVFIDTFLWRGLFLPKRTGVYIPDELDERLRDYMRKMGVKSKSKLIQEAIRNLVIEYEWMSKGRVAGLIGIMYKHGVKGVDDKLNDIQHNYVDIISCHVHLHLSKEKCMLVILVRGDSDRIQGLIKDLNSVKGIRLARPLILGIE
jgi:CopG family nickel-responsive transcriptional regulator